MKTKLVFLSVLTITALAIAIGWNLNKTTNESIPLEPMVIDAGDNPDSRINWETQRIADPRTGKIPARIRAGELAYAQTLRQQAPARKTEGLDIQPVGPFNVGGRTRSVAIDVTNSDIMIAGSVSGSIWRTTDAGQSWTQVNDPADVYSITTIVQDTRPGKTDNWYYASGESIGNSASASFSANYIGNGIYHSADGGLTWNVLPSTFSDTPQEINDFDRCWRVAIDPSVTDRDILYACLQGEIMRSEDGGQTWTQILNAASLQFGATDIVIDENGVAYATLAGNAGDRGIWRSDDHGDTWTDITPGFWPASTRRAVLTFNPSNTNEVFFLASTPGAGQVTDVFFGGTEGNSLWKYTYVSGDGTGSGGIWENRSNNIPDNLGNFGNFNTQGSYNMAIAVKPDEPNVIFLGSTNIYRSTDGFTSQDNTAWIGGYEVSTELPFFGIYENHHPDQHFFAFLPSNPDVMINANDGGLYRTEDCTDPLVVWSSLNNGYRTTQFYTVAVDHGTPGSNVVTGGLQDNGSWWTNSDDPTAIWTFPSTGDGAFIGIEDGGGNYYYSRQRGRVIKTQLDANGEVTGFNRMDPITGSNNPGYLFINPFILDPSDNNIMYLPEGEELWRNDSLSAIPLTGEWDSINTGWFRYNFIPISGRISAIAASVSNPAHRVYFGTSSRRIYRMDDAHQGNPPVTDVTNNISSGGYTHCIAIDPRDADKVAIVYSNYNTVSMHYSEDGGDTWEQIAGNLEEPTTPPVPAGIGNGPSCRWLSIIPTDDGTVYLAGTSVGLFATDTLLGDSTVWVPQGANTIGSVVVDMIDYRESDGFVAISTHGNGMFTTTVKSTYQVTSADQPELVGGLKLYPNPAIDRTRLEYTLNTASKVQYSLTDIQGRIVEQRNLGQQLAGAQVLELDLAHLPAGVYFYRLAAGETPYSGKLLIQR